MSWKDRESAGFKIQTGDRQIYTPFWMRQAVSKKFDFNISKFNFKGVSGTLVKRGTNQGMVYVLEIKFQGDDHLTQSDNFLNSAKNPNYWTIIHPDYGTFICQPISIDFDNKKANVTTITCDVCETITDTGLDLNKSPSDIISSNTQANIQDYTQRMLDTLFYPNVSVLQAIKNFGDSMYKSTQSFIAPLQKDLTDFNNAYNTLNGFINQAIFNAGSLITALQTFINFPVKFSLNVKARLEIYTTSLNNLYLSITSLSTPATKKTFENNAGVIIASMCQTTITNVGSDYTYMPDVLNTCQILIDNYNMYIDNLNSLQTDNNGAVNSYFPDAQSIIDLQNLLFYTVSSLLKIAATSKKQFTYIIPYDTNVIPLAYKLYGLLQDDSTIIQLLNNNNIGMNGTDELLILKAGRKIVYYI